MKRILFYVISATWGGVMSLLGLVATLILFPFAERRVFHGRIYTVIGANWGGVCLGCFFFVGKSSANSDHTRAHECGHGLQNCIWGPLFPFVIAIPSMIRYWYREYTWRKNPEKYKTLPDYDAIWFEGQATRWGKKYVLTDII